MSSAYWCHCQVVVDGAQCLVGMCGAHWCLVGEPSRGAWCLPVLMAVCHCLPSATASWYLLVPLVPSACQCPADFRAHKNSGKFYSHDDGTVSPVFNNSIPNTSALVPSLLFLFPDSMYLKMNILVSGSMLLLFLVGQTIPEAQQERWPTFSESKQNSLLRHSGSPFLENDIGFCSWQKCHLKGSRPLPSPT